MAFWEKRWHHKFTLNLTNLLVKDKFLITSEPDSCSDNLDNSLFWLLHIEVSSFTLATRSWKTWTLWLTNLDLNLDWKQNKSKNLSKGPIFSEKYWYYFHCPQNVLCSILRFVFWTFPPFKTAVQLESDQSTISKYIFQDSFRHIFWAMRKMHHIFWKKRPLVSLPLIQILHWPILIILLFAVCKLKITHSLWPQDPDLPSWAPKKTQTLK